MYNLTILEAVDNLSSMAELDTLSSEELQGEVAEAVGPRQWLDVSHLEEKREQVRKTFQMLHSYLRHVYENKGQLKERETQKGIHAMMALAEEAARKLDSYAPLFKGESVTALKEYRELQQFYLTKVVRRFEEVLQSQEDWEEELAAVGEGVGPDIEQRGLKDLDMVRRDAQYELFYIRREDGTPFFNSNLVRHIKLIGDFDEIVGDPKGEDPLVQVKAIQDRDIHASAKEILHLVMPQIDEFYKEALHHKEISFVAALNKALMALMLTANSRNLIQNTTGKSCISYYRDFHSYLREALGSFEYQKTIASPPDSGEHFTQVLRNLLHALCGFFFLRVGTRKEAVELIHRLVQKRDKSEEKKGDRSLWESLLDKDEHIRDLLKRYPSGPLMKILDLFREEEREIGFDPFLQDNLPRQLFSFSSPLFHVSCLYLPSPTKQEYINKADIADEFRGFLRYLSSNLKGQKHLLVNLQDRTSWQEHTRSIVLEGLQKEAEFSSSLLVVTLPKHTDFYQQTASYLNLNDSAEFTEQFQEQINSGEQCGFFFPSSMKTEQWDAFIKQTFRAIHSHLFAGKRQLSRTNRLDFIEIFYQLLCLKMVEVFVPDSLSFTCKDGVDAGAAADAAFFSFLKQMKGDFSWNEGEQDFLLWLLYNPALTVRERSIDPQRLSRTLNALACLQSVAEKGGLRPLISLFAPQVADLKVESTNV